MKKAQKFIFRMADGKIKYLEGQNADHSLNQIGSVVCWDGDSNTVDVRMPSGRVEKITFMGVR